MDCKEVEKMIPDFLNNNLNSRDLKNFMDHVDGCEDCREELSIQFLVQEGMVRLEEGDAFDLQNEFDWLIENAHRKMRINRIVNYFVYGMEILAILAILLIIVLIIVL